jgi:hypothetical protein
MSASGICYDIAVAESFFATLKKELVHGCAFERRSEAYDAISDFIENYYDATPPLGRQKSITHQLRDGQFQSACRIITLTICPGNPVNSTRQGSSMLEVQSRAKTTMKCTPVGAFRRPQESYTRTGLRPRLRLLVGRTASGLFGLFFVAATSVSAFV